MIWFELSDNLQKCQEDQSKILNDQLIFDKKRKQDLFGKKKIFYEWNSLNEFFSLLLINHQKTWLSLV